MYFSHDTEGFMIHDTEAEARNVATKSLEYERDQARGNGEWDDDVEVICWGKVSERVVQTESGPEYWDFGLKATDIKEK